ncbi:MAG: hypothetical protein H6706_29425 [Myxococcales bacterium]|nr:hypothetical protein [Myxococcales bacterium]
MTRIAALGLALAACDPAVGPAPDVTEAAACAPGDLDHPQALAFLGDTLVVASTGYATPDWGTGRVTFFDVDASRATAVQETAWQNPQGLAVHDGRVLVASTGVYDFSGSLPRMATPGGIEIVDPAHPRDGARTIPLDIGPDGRAGGPVDVVVVGDRLFISSGIAPRVHVYDLARQVWVRGPSDPVVYGDGDLGLGTLATDGRRVVLVDYNADRLHLLDAVTGEPWACSVDLGESPELEGAKAPVIVGDDLYVVLDQAGLVRRVRLPADAADACPGLRAETVAVTGLLPNDLAVRDDRLYVVHSGDNNIQVLDLATFDPVDLHVLPPGSNPWQLVFHPGRPLAAVSEWQASGVTLIDLADGHQRRLRCDAETPPVAAPPAGPDPIGEARLADEVRAAPSAGDGPFRDPFRAVNGVRGGGDAQGGLDVFSLGTTPDVDDHVVLCWSDGPITAGPGPELVVFENPFQGFVDPVIVEVSADGEAWATFPHDYRGDDETRYDPDPALWVGFAGVTPVRFHAEDHRVDPFDAAAAGGDAFDFDDLDASDAAARVRAEGAACVRLVSAQARVNPDSGQAFPVAPVADGADIDGVYGRIR